MNAKILSSPANFVQVVGRRCRRGGRKRRRKNPVRSAPGPPPGPCLLSTINLASAPAIPPHPRGTTAAETTAGMTPQAQQIGAAGGGGGHVDYMAVDRLHARPPRLAAAAELARSQELLDQLRKLLSAGGGLELVEEATRRISDAVRVLTAGGCDGGCGLAKSKCRTEDAGKRKEKAKRRRCGASPGATRITAKTLNDGHAWRKYGQKNIQNAKNPRSYFRCTYKHDRGCQATRQVQRSEEDPSTYHVTYIGEHTCMDGDGRHGPQQRRTRTIDFGSPVQPRDPPRETTSMAAATTATQASDLLSEQGGDVTSTFHASTGPLDTDFMDDVLLPGLWCVGEHSYPFLDL